MHRSHGEVVEVRRARAAALQANVPESALAASVVQQSACHALGSAAPALHTLARTRVSPLARVVRNLNEYQRVAG